MVSSKCLALLDTGAVCAAATVPGLRYCEAHARIFGADRTRLGHALRRAMLRPDRYLAAALAEWPDEDLAAETGADPGKVWQLRLCGWPRNSAWAADVRQLAALVDADPRALAR